MAITLTEAAAERVRRYTKQQGRPAAVRLGVRRSGCSGFSYVLEFADEVKDGDRVFESRGVKVVVDAESLTYLDGTELDFTKEGFNEGFRFHNPNVKEVCGCGESFNA